MGTEGTGLGGASINRPVVRGAEQSAQEKKAPPKLFPMSTGRLVPARNAVISSQKRMPWSSPVASISKAKSVIDNQKDAFSLFYPLYKKRIGEFQHKEINTKILQQALKFAEDFSHSENTLEQIYDGLNKLNPAMPDYVKYLLECQYGRRQKGFGPTNSNSSDHPSYASFFDFFRHYEKEEIIDVLNAAIFYQNVRLEINAENHAKDDKHATKTVSLIFTDSDKQEHTLVTAKLEKGKMHYELDEKTPSGLKDKALLHMADMIASNRQENSSNYVKLTMGNPIEVMRLASILICHHHMYVDLANIKDQVTEQLDFVDAPNKAELKKQWQKLCQYSTVFHMVNPERSSHPGLKGAAFDDVKSQIKGLFADITATLDPEQPSSSPRPESSPKSSSEPPSPENPAEPDPTPDPSATLSPNKP